MILNSNDIEEDLHLLLTRALTRIPVTIYEVEFPSLRGRVVKYQGSGGHTLRRHPYMRLRDSSYPREA